MDVGRGGSEKTQTREMDIYYQAKAFGKFCVGLEIGFHQAAAHCFEIPEPCAVQAGAT